MLRDPIAAHVCPPRFRTRWGMGAYPGGLTAEDTINEELRTAMARPPGAPDDCHLRSSKVITGYHVHATDGDIGHVDDLLVDDQTWAIRYLVVDTNRWWSGRRVLVAPRWIDDVSWSTATVSVDVTRHAIQGAPPYDSEAHLDRQREQALHDHYGRSGYWTAHLRSRREPGSVEDGVNR